MNESWKSDLWRQFGASIDMLENAIVECPESLWSDCTRYHQYWYLAHHTLFWLDLYLTGSVEGFAPPEPFTLCELDPAGLLPDRVYSQAEMKSYLEHCRVKCRSTIEQLDAESASRLYKFGWGECSFGELLLYNMRHVQHHTAQMNLLMRLHTDSAPRWVGRSKPEA